MMPAPVSSNVFDRPADSILGIGYSLLVDAAQTNGSYELMKFVVPPGAAPPPHVHSNEDEGFLVVEGTIELLVGDDTVQAEQGTYVHLPRGVQHTFKNPGDVPATFLCWVMPGNLAGFFDSFKQPWPSTAEMPAPPAEDDIGKLLAAAEKYGIEIRMGN